MTARAARRCLILLAVFFFIPAAFSQQLNPILLPAPQIQGGKPLMQVLKERRSVREFGPEKLSPQMISNLLWAANGFNRPDKRTAPSASNRQEIDIYVAMADGLYLYDAKANVLKPILPGDIRALTGMQPYVKDAPLNLVYVADTSRMKSSGSDQVLYAAADTGFISENVYLFCASEGLVTVVRGMIDRQALSRAMKLRAEQKIILAQAVGYPRK